MMTLLIKWLINAVAIFLVGTYMSGIHIPDYQTALWSALILGILNVTIRPILRVLSFPITILTLGLFALVVNGFTFWLAAKFIDGFYVDTFWWAVLGAFIVSIIATILNRVVFGSDGKLGVTEE